MARERRASAWDRFVRPPSRVTEQREEFGGYPSSESEWRDRYEYLRACYHLEPYTDEVLDALHLFQAEDDSEKELARTRRLVRDFAFVIDKVADHLFRGGIALETAEADDDSRPELRALQEQGDAIMERSRLSEQEGMLAHDIALGRTGLEPRRIRRSDDGFSYDVVLVPHRPETYTVITDDETGTETVEVVIRSSFYDAADFDDNGDRADDATLHHYVRRLTRDEVIVTLDGERVEAESGPHGLGVVPFVNLVFKPTRETEHGVSAAHGLDMALALIDSLYTQAHAVGTRFADPILAGKNVKLDGASVGRFGRSISWEQKVGVESEVKYLEPDMKGVQGILAAIEKLHTAARATMPEFGLFDASAAASGEALKTLEQAFIAKAEAGRRNVLPKIARAVAMGVAMERDVAFDLSAPLYRCKCGPVLALDVATELGAVMDAKQEGLIDTADAIRHAQRLGLVPMERDPEEYAIKVQEERSGRAVEFLRPGDDPNPALPPGTAIAEALEDLRAALEALEGETPDLAAVAEEIRAAVAGLDAAA